MFDAEGLIGARVTTLIANPVPGIYYAAEADDEGALGVFWSDATGEVYASEMFEEAGGSSLSAETIGKLDAAQPILLASVYVPTEAPVLLVPQPAPDLSLCRVFGYLETLDNQPAIGVAVSFTLVAPGAARSERLLTLKQVKATTNGEGYFSLDLQRNDQLTPAGTSYQVQCEKAGLKDVSITLTSPLFDLSSLAT
jgi:hypothetical protein